VVIYATIGTLEAAEIRATQRTSVIVGISETAKTAMVEIGTIGTIKTGTVEMKRIEIIADIGTTRTETTDTETIRIEAIAMIKIEVIATIKIEAIARIKIEAIARIKIEAIATIKIEAIATIKIGAIEMIKTKATATVGTTEIEIIAVIATIRITGRNVTGNVTGTATVMRAPSTKSPAPQRSHPSDTSKTTRRPSAAIRSGSSRPRYSG
jgi:hypothetical protein